MSEPSGPDAEDEPSVEELLELFRGLDDDQLLQRLRVLDDQRAQLQKAVQDVTARLGTEIVAVDRARPDQWGWRSQIVGAVQSQSRVKVFEVLGVADLQDRVAAQLAASGVDPESYRIGSGTFGQVVLALAEDVPATEAAVTAQRIQEALSRRDLVIVPTSARKPKGSAQEQADALTQLSAPGGRVAVIHAHRRH